MTKIKEIINGKNKIVYSTENPDILILSFKSDKVKYNGGNKGPLGKGAVNNKISNNFFRILEKHNIPTHFYQEIDMNETAVKNAHMLPFETVLYNFNFESLYKKYEVLGGKLINPTVEYYSLTDKKQLTIGHLVELKSISENEIGIVEGYAHQINKCVSDFLLEIGLELARIKLKFGRFNGKIIIADELALDNFLFYDIKKARMFDGDDYEECQTLLNKLLIK